MTTSICVRSSGGIFLWTYIIDERSHLNWRCRMSFLEELNERSDRRYWWKSEVLYWWGPCLDDLFPGVLPVTETIML